MFCFLNKGNPNWFVKTQTMAEVELNIEKNRAAGDRKIAYMEITAFEVNPVPGKLMPWRTGL